MLLITSLGVKDVLVFPVKEKEVGCNLILIDFKSDQVHVAAELFLRVQLAADNLKSPGLSARLQSWLTTFKFCQSTSK